MFLAFLLLCHNYSINSISKHKVEYTEISFIPFCVRLWIQEKVCITIKNIFRNIVELLITVKTEIFPLKLDHVSFMSLGTKQSSALWFLGRFFSLIQVHFPLSLCRCNQSVLLHALGSFFFFLLTTTLVVIALSTVSEEPDLTDYLWLAGQ